MNKRTFTFMALVLVAATALTAATAFAGSKKKPYAVQEQAIESTNLTSAALLRLKLRHRLYLRKLQPPPVIVLPPPGKIR